jgi:hypothetical protein
VRQPNINREEIGRDMVEKEKKAAWRSGLIERLSLDLTYAFPDMKGFSRRNLYAIRHWYLFYSALSTIVPQPVAQLKIKGCSERGLALYCKYYSNYSGILQTPSAKYLNSCRQKRN